MLARTVPLALAALVLTAGRAPSRQESPRRERLAGRVLDRDDKPWTGARVSLVSQVAPRSGVDDAPDVVVVTSDERGRFVAQVLPARAYTAWAVGSDEDAKPRATHILDGAFAGRPIRLREGEPRPRLRLVVRGTKAWDAHGGVAFRLEVGSVSSLRRPLELDAEGSCELPVLPGKTVMLEVTSRDGMHRFQTARIPLLTDSRTKLAERERKVREVRKKESLPPFEPGSTFDTQVVEMRAPVLVRIRVIDIDDEKPIAGAAVFENHTESWSLRGRTNAQGIADIVVPSPRTSRTSGTAKASLTFLVDAEGYGQRLTRKQLVFPRPEREKAGGKDGESDDEGMHVVFAKLGKGKSVKGRVFVTKGVPAAGMGLLYEAPINMQKNSWTSYGHGHLYRTRADGSFRIPSPPVYDGESTSVEFRLVTVLRGGALEQMRAKAGARFPLSPVLHLAYGAVDGTEDVDLGDLVLDDFRQARVRVVDAAGAPVRYPKLVARSADAKAGGISHSSSAPPMRGNKRGQLCVLLGPGKHEIGATDGTAFGSASLEFAKTDPRGAAPPVLELRLGEVGVIRGRVVDGAGKPLADATVDWWPDYDNANIRRVEIVNLLRNSRAIRREGTAVDGSFTIRVPLRDARYILSAYVQSGKRLVRCRGQYRVRVDEEGSAEEVEIEIPDAPVTPAKAPSTAPVGEKKEKKDGDDR